MSPRPRPIMLIHGFHGERGNWTQPGGLFDALVAQGFDPALIHIFHYGERPGPDDEPIYDNQGDIREIASRLSARESDILTDLESQVDRLSAESVAAGGPPGVTLICHSMGGLIARYYLSRREPDEFGTHYGGKVARLIELASPNLGTNWLRVVPLIPQDSFIWKLVGWIERLPFAHGRTRRALQEIQQQVAVMQEVAQVEALGPRPRGLADSPALRQMAPGSPFLTELNRRPPPPDIDLHTLYGDVRFALHLRWGPLLLWSRAISLGDLLIAVPSARTIPGATPRTRGFTWGREWTVQLGQPPAPATRDLADLLPPVAHSRLLINPAVHEAILAILNA